MNEINDGGTAFPYVLETEFGNIQNEGMTLRDYFAGQALAGLLATGDYFPNDFSAKEAYKCADEMLKKRGQK